MPDPSCLNLRELFGSVYRISWEDGSTHRDPWEMQIRTRCGLIYPYGGNRLAVQVDFRPGIARQVGKIPGVELIQRGDDEVTYRFDLSLFEAVARIVRPYRLPALTDEQREAAAERGRALAARQMSRRGPASEAPFSA